MIDLNQPDGQQAGHATSPDVVLTRSAEELRITVYRPGTQRAQLTNYIATEAQTRTVEVRHERPEAGTEPISGAAPHSVIEDREISEDLRCEQLAIDTTRQMEDDDG